MVGSFRPENHIVIPNAATTKTMQNTKNKRRCDAKNSSDNLQEARKERQRHEPEETNRKQKIT